jgi:hypothetical protein
MRFPQDLMKGSGAYAEYIPVPAAAHHRASQGGIQGKIVLRVN